MRLEKSGDRNDSEKLLQKILSMINGMNFKTVSFVQDFISLSLKAIKSIQRKLEFLMKLNIYRNEFGFDLKKSSKNKMQIYLEKREFKQQ